MKKTTESPEPFIVRYLHAKAAENNIPINATFELTSRCNFSCKMCYVHNTDCAKNKPHELTADEWIKVAEEVKKAGCIFLLITGGEPFIREDFCEIYDALSSMGFVISLNTNLSMLNDKILESFKKNRPNRVNVSLYAADNSAYTDLCGVPAFETVSRNIQRLKEAGIPVKVNSSITPYNVSSLDTIMQYCDDNELVFKGTGYMFPALRAKNEISRLTPADAAKVRAKIDYHTLGSELFAQRTDRILNGIEFERDNDCIDDSESFSKVRCRAGTTSVWIDWKGNVSPCGMIPADESNNIKKLGFAQCRQNVLEQTLAIRMPEKCTNCVYKHICNICAASAFCETGGYGKCPEYLEKMCSFIPDEYSRLLRKEEENETEL